jgi:LysR family transcriptional regulator, cys regulon transcriptional activator
MKLQQLRYVLEITRHGNHLSAAAEALNTSQPGVSRQIQLLEAELGFEIFLRTRNRIIGLTPPGKHVVDIARRVVEDVGALRSLKEQVGVGNKGVLTIGTTHTQARYVLPRVIRDFRQKYPDVQLHLHQGTSDQIAEMATLDRIDFAINTGSQEKFPDFVLLPIYTWHRQIIVPKDHPLAQVAKPTLQQLAEYPLVTYVFSFTGPSSLHQQFARAGLEPNVSLTARDADVIKTYVRLGLGVGVVASMAIEPDDEKDLAVVEAGHLFPQHVTWIGFRSGALLRGFTYDFIQLLAPHLTRERIERTLSAPTPAAREKLISGIEVPRYD